MDERRRARELSAQRVSNKLHNWEHVYHWHSEENEALEDNVYICNKCGAYTTETDDPLMWGCKGDRNEVREIQPGSTDKDR